MLLLSDSHCVMGVALGGLRLFARMGEIAAVGIGGKLRGASSSSYLETMDFIDWEHNNFWASSGGGWAEARMWKAWRWARQLSDDRLLKQTGACV